MRELVREQAPSAERGRVELTLPEVDVVVLGERTRVERGGGVSCAGVGMDANRAEVGTEEVLVGAASRGRQAIRRSVAWRLRAPVSGSRRCRDTAADECAGEPVGVAFLAVVALRERGTAVITLRRLVAGLTQ